MLTYVNIGAAESKNAMAKKGQHVVPAIRGGWAVRRTGSARASKTFPTQDAAIAYARDKARQEHGELYIHRADGTIRDRNSYGNDPHPPKG
ncbi:hypothetical protein CHKEEEPN_1311 [Methylorubrum podarium]|jgi:Uncharacterized protein conserved in bacteria (DUF2188)|nr:hypothetical protein CHKEEEPN_1311 [Methylorubrum podarium]